jgi:hypothetical protein
MLNLIMITVTNTVQSVTKQFSTTQLYKDTPRDYYILKIRAIHIQFNETSDYEADMSNNYYYY